MSSSRERRIHALADDLREDVEESFADVPGEGEMRVEMPFEMIVEDAADAARDVAVGKPEIFVGPFGKARIEGRIVGGAGGAQPRVEGFGVVLVGNCRVEVGAAAEPALGRGQEARVHMDRGHVRIGHVRDEADAGGEEARVFFRAGDALGEFGREAAADGRDVDADLLEHLADHLAANTAAAGLATVRRCGPTA